MVLLFPLMFISFIILFLFMISEKFILRTYSIIIKNIEVLYSVRKKKNQCSHFIIIIHLSNVNQSCFCELL